MKGWVRILIDLPEDEYLQLKEKKTKLNKTWKEILFDWYQLTEKEEVTNKAY